MKYLLRHHTVISKVVAFLSATAIITLLSMTLVYAQGDGRSASGDEICGASSASKCTLADLKTITGRILVIVISIGLPILVVVIASRFLIAFFAAVQGNQSAYKDAIQKSTNAVLGFIFILFLFGGGLYAALSLFGVDEDILQILNLFSTAVIPHAYAQTIDAAGNPLNPTNATSLYEVILSVLRLTMRFIIYPGLIVMWVWTGFSFVLAQGAPDALTKAKRYLVRALVSTLVVVTIQGLLSAAQVSVERVIPKTAGQVGGTSQTSTPENKTAPVPTSAGSGGGANYDSRITGVPDVSCTRANGGRCRINGQAGTCNDFICVPDTAQSASIMGDPNYDSRLTTVKESPCTIRNGGTCRVNGIDGTCQDYVCVSNKAPSASFIDSCLSEGAQLNTPCATREGKNGLCKLNITNNKFVCIVDPMAN